MTHIQMIWRLSLFIMLAFVIFGSFPEIDLFVTNTIYKSTGFWDHPVLDFIRNFYFRGSFYVLYFFLLLTILALFKNRQVPAKIYGFFVLLGLLGPITLINGVFKSHWGRARPIDIEEFGGDKIFTPAQIFPVDQCAHDCSFTSGEGAAAATLIFAFILMFGRTRKARIIIWSALLPMALLRILFGMHFVSDTIFSFLFIWLIGYILLGVMRLKTSELLIEKGAFWKDIYTIPEIFIRPFRKSDNPHSGES